MPIPPPLDPPDRLLCGPGPSDVEPSVLAAMRRPMLGHLDPTFHAVLDEVTAMLRAVWRMPDGDVLALPSTGTSAMEAGIANLLEPGDTAIVAEAGYFGRRLADIAERHGANVVRVAAPWGETVPNAAILDALDRHPEASLIAVVHAETSTGALHPLRELGTELFGYDILLMADCVTSLGGVPLETGRWGVDYAYSCTQKCLAAPPGMAPVAISPRAWRRIRVAPHAGPVLARPRAAAALLVQAPGDLPPHDADPRRLRAARGAPPRARRGPRGPLDAARGPPPRTCRRSCARAGWSCSPTRAARWRRSPPCACPTDVDGKSVQARMLAEHGIEIGGGLGPDAPPIWRIGLMGRNATVATATRVLAALDEVMEPARELALA